jgi:hypothetical protein
VNHQAFEVRDCGAMAVGEVAGSAGKTSCKLARVPVPSTDSGSPPPVAGWRCQGDRDRGVEPVVVPELPPPAERAQVGARSPTQPPLRQRP